ncbi:MAG: non-homologous end joining protein Ku [Terriglobales bacterium]
MAGVWSGYLTFGLVTLPVRLYSGARGERISFHQLHAKDQVRLKQQMICPADHQVVGRDETVKGYEYAKGAYVVIPEAEIKQAAPSTDKQMEVVEFCRAEELDPLWFEASHYLVPETAGRRPYALLEQVLEETGFVAIARLSMHNREYHAAIRPSHLAGVEGKHRGLLLHTLYYRDELRVAEGFGESSAEAPPNEVELQLARKLVEGLARPFNPAEFHDTYRHNLEQLIEAKLAGQPTAKPAARLNLVPMVDLMASLKQSLELVGKGARKPPARVSAHSAKRKAAVARRRTA